MQMVAESAGPAENIDRSVLVFKRHLPYHESDHVLNIAYNLLAAAAVWNRSNCGTTMKSSSLR